MKTAKEMKKEYDESILVELQWFVKDIEKQLLEAGTSSMWFEEVSPSQQVRLVTRLREMGYEVSYNESFLYVDLPKQLD